MKKMNSFFYQAGILIQRCFNILFNDKKQLLLNIALPLATILIVCLVACGDMYAIKPEKKHKINDGYPVLNWETVVQEKESDDKDEDNELIEPEESVVSKWDGTSVEMPSSPTKIDGENYFLITNAKQLAFLSKAIENGYEEYLTYNYILQCDIDLKSKKFTPIGSNENPFVGTFDGNGHVISNLKINSDDNNVGLFACVSSDASKKTKVDVEQPMYGTSLEMNFYHNGLIKNFEIKNADVKSSGNNVAIVVGNIKNTARVTSVCVKDGKVESKNGNVGGIVGYANSEKTEIYLCYSTATVKSKGNNVGGLVGRLGEARLSGSYFVGEISYTGKSSIKNIGMIAGQCNNVEEQIKNAFYDNEIDNKYKAVKDKDFEDLAFGKETDDLKNSSSFLVPYKDIKTHYDLLHLSEEDEDRYDQDDYDVEEDDDIDDVYGFKKDGQVMAFASTQTGLFMLVCVAIFVGICNSIQEICKERSILKREYMTNLNLGSYVVSKLVVQGVICAVQMLCVIIVFMLFVKNKELPSGGVFLGSMWVEYFITMFLLAFAADTMSLLISSVVKSSELASTFIPIVLIVQIVFSGVLFEMTGAFDVIANFMISKWGINALAASSFLNDSQSVFIIENPQLQLQLGSELSIVKTEYASTAGNLLMIWGILLVFIVVSSIACGILLRRVKKDKR